MELFSFAGVGVRVRTRPVGESGTNCFKTFCAAGLRQPARMTLPATQGRPVESVSGCPVKAFSGSFSVLLRAVKSPLRCADVGTSAVAEPACGRFQSF